MQERLIPVPYSKTSTDQAVRASNFLSRWFALVLFYVFSVSHVTPLLPFVCVSSQVKFFSVLCDSVSFFSFYRLFFPQDSKRFCVPFASLMILRFLTKITFLAVSLQFLYTSDYIDTICLFTNSPKTTKVCVPIPLSAVPKKHTHDNEPRTIFSLSLYIYLSTIKTSP